MPRTHTHRTRRTLPAPPRPAALLLPAALVLAGCGSDGGATGDDAGSGGGSEVTLTVLAAASLTDVFEEAGAAYTEEHPGTAVRFSFAGSQELVAQLHGGAPADVLVTADTDTMASAAGLTGEPETVARNELVLITPPDNPADVEGLADLDDPGLRLVLAAPEVPAGRYGQQILREQGVEAEPDSLEPNVRAVLGKVRWGEADAGLVYATDAVVAGDDVHTVPVPEERNVLAEYPAATLNEAEHPDEAADFVSWLNEETARGLLAEAGFLAP
ncbi:molybdate transport system substrate-binding protein [Streptomyces zhaozhouensis]|uniref:Molybdate transport system substrate-binding protein n=1 Tax=Streptomyces zhaozhouensis TaxID=1300267 RepID=A0A286DQP8_9ACTN|nr:molybdate ABC transporter substrate-binding protein [Streptomyces zhaozhouensis]SOD60995.1 molybdate transport system substrate-binding protein [Streptomyces zhaozhouensis]